MLITRLHTIFPTHVLCTVNPRLSAGGLSALRIIRGVQMVQWLVFYINGKICFTNIVTH